MKAVSHSRVGVAVVSAIAFCMIASGAISARAQLLYSFEPGLEGWTATTATLTNSSFGATDGTKSLLIDNLGPNFNNDAGTATVGSGNVYNVWNDAAAAIAAGKTNVKLEFDFSWDLTNVTGPAAFAQFAVWVNSTGAGFKQYGTGGLLGGNVGTGVTDFFPRLDPPAVNDGVTLTSLAPNTIHLAIPLGPTKSLNIGGGSGNFYQMGFKTNGSWGGTVDWAVDNIRISGVQVPTTAETLFSWETPDNPGTPSVDERFEGWVQGGVGTNPPHVHSITTTGATDGTHALQIDRTNTPSGFTWGSSFTLNSVVNPGPSQTIDPTIQAQIESLIGKISAADRVAFDVTYKYQDLFPLPNPTYTQFGVFFADETGHQFQAFGPGVDVAGATNQTTTTVQIPLADFVDATDSNLTLKTTGLLANSHFLQIALSTNTDGAQIYQIDNFRLLTEVPQGVPGDYNDNGIVDAADYVVWRKHLGQTFQLPNEISGTTPGSVTQEDFAAWRARFGSNSGSGSIVLGSAVPEPAAVALMLSAFAALIMSRCRVWAGWDPFVWRSSPASLPPVDSRRTA